jgi:hypothetical protein
MSWNSTSPKSENERPSDDASTSSIPTLGERLAVSNRCLLPGTTRWLRNAWTYEPRGPSFFVELIRLHDSKGQFEEWNLLEGAVARFADLCVPQWSDHQASIVDSYRTQVLGYGFGDIHRDVHGPYGWWFGCQRSYELLAQYHDPMEVAIWETKAREAAS